MSRSVSLPDIPVWLLRLGADTDFALELTGDPLLFAAYFAAIADVFHDWPDDLAEELAKADTADQDDMLKLMATLRNKTSAPVSGTYSSRFREAQIAHRYYRRRPEDFRSLMAERLKLLELAVKGDVLISSARPAVALLERLAGFNPLETQLVNMALALRADTAFYIFQQLATEDMVRARRVLPLMMGCAPQDLVAALTKDSALINSGLLPVAPRGRALQPLSEFWTELLFSEIHSEGQLRDALLVPFEARESSGAVGRLHPEDQSVLQSLFAEKGVPALGTNVLIYGPTSINKKSVVERLIGESHLVAWGLQSREAVDADLASVCYFAQRALAATHPEDVLVVEKASNVLTGRKVLSFLFFEIASEDDGEIATVDQALLARNPVRTIWMAVAATRLSEESLGRFLFHAELKRGSRAERRQKVQEIITTLGLSEKLQQALTLQAGLSEQQLRTAVNLANITAKGDPRLTEAHILHAVQRSQSALARREKEDLRIPVTEYSLEYLNTSGKFGAPKLIEALRKRPTASLCFYGIPGTGKTNLAEHIAAELDKPLIARRASELLDKYLGESEKRLAEMFAEAEADEAVLLLDEADTFLRDRSLADKQWEVSQVNELLKAMEAFPGIFICATNLFNDIDSAALRRFTFKLEFLKLTEEQAWKMYLNESGMGKKLASFSQSDIDGFREQLKQIDWLTPGDFATVKRQCILLDEELTYDEWLSQLAIETNLKKKSMTRTKIGFSE